MLRDETAAARKYRIAYIIDGLGMGGAERLMVPILKYLSRLHFEPYVCVMQTKDGNPFADDLRKLGVPVESLEIRHLRDLDAIPRLVKYLKGIRADLVHTQLESSNILGNISAKLLRLPSVCTIHVLPELDVKTKTKLHQKVEWFILRHFCDRVIAVAEAARQHHIQISGSSPDQVITIHNGIELAPFANVDHALERDSVRTELGLPSGVNVLISVAVLRPTKGIQYMIRALPAVLASHPDTYYLVVGDGSHRGTLVEEVNKAGVQDRVIFTGTRRDVPRLMAASDILVLPSMAEALPTVIEEAMANRLPVIASRIAGVPEMIVQGQNGLMVAPQDVKDLAQACNDLLEHPEKRARVSAEGWKTVNQKFKIERQVEQLKDLYLELLQAYGKT
jgi:glycosyltransferase involved in cell wall biosynthesis